MEGDGVIPILDGSNYRAWSRRFMAAMSVKGLDHCFAAEMPSGADATRKAQDKKAAGYIQIAVSEKYLDLLEEDDSAYQMWTTLKDVFNKQDTAKWLDYRGQLSSLTKRAEESIEDYVARAQGLSAALKNIGKPVAEAEVVAQLLQGLPEDYEVWRAIMRRNKEEELTYSNFMNLMLEAELTLARQGRFIDPSMTATALFSSASVQKFKGVRAGSSQRKCYYCEEAGHFAKECPLKAEDEEAAERLRQYMAAKERRPGVATFACAF